MSTNRLNVIDVAKGIGIILVVFAHVNYTHELLVFIYSFHMPLFFIVSGILFQKEKYPKFGDFVKRRFKGLMVPYIIYELLSICCLYGAERIYGVWQLFDVSKEQYLEYIYQIAISNWSRVHVNQPLWFLPCLFLVEILYFFLAKLQPIIRVPVCAGLVTVGWILESGMLPFDNFLLPWSLDSALVALGFYMIGNLAAPYIKNAILKIKKYRYKTVFCVELSVLIFMVLLPLAMMNEKITLGSKILNNGFLLFINGVLGTVLILVISILLEKNRFLMYCGRNSFQIMASHYIIRNYIVRPVYRILTGRIYDRENLKESMLPFLAVFCLSLLFTIIYDKVRGKWIKSRI